MPSDSAYPQSDYGGKTNAFEEEREAQHRYAGILLLCSRRRIEDNDAGEVS